MPVKLRLVEQEGYAFTEGGGLGDIIHMSLFSTVGKWWADPDFGSEIEFIFGELQTPEQLSRLQGTCQRATQWLVDDGVVASMTVVVTIGERGIPLVNVTAQRPGNVPDKFRAIWELAL